MDKFDFMGHIPMVIFIHILGCWWGPGGGAVAPRVKVKGAAN
jgi:hypothetical protein